MHFVHASLGPDIALRLRRPRPATQQMILRGTAGAVASGVAPRLQIHVVSKIRRLR